MNNAIEIKPKLIKVFRYTDEIIEIMEVDYTFYGKIGGRKGKKSSEVSKEDRERNLKRVKKNVRRLVFSNDLGQVHLVLTYKNNMQDTDKADQHFKEFMKLIHKQYKSLKYLATREFQKRGALHYHVLLNQRVNIKVAQEFWKHGFITLVGHKNKLKAVMYVLKYISKDVGEIILQTSKGYTKKAYLSSKGLKKELEAYTLSFLINQSEQYDEYSRNIEALIEKFSVGWDIPFEVEIDGCKILKGRSILRCAANNY